MGNKKKNLVQKIEEYLDLKNNYNLEPYRSASTYEKEKTLYEKTISKIASFAQKNITNLDDTLDKISNLRSSLCYGVIYDSGAYFRWHDEFDKLVDLLERTKYPKEFLDFVEDISKKIWNKNYGYNTSEEFNSIDGGDGGKARIISRAAENLIDIESQPYVDGKYLSKLKKIGELLYNFDLTNIKDERVYDAVGRKMDIPLPSKLFIKYISNFKKIAAKFNLSKLEAIQKKFAQYILEYGKNAEAVISTELGG